MKTTFCFKHILPILVTVVTVGFASSCQDQNFDWDEARANTAKLQFENVFIKEFGKPAEGHQWGFDFANLSMGGLEMNTSSSQTRASYKAEEMIRDIDASLPPNIRLYEYFGQPAEISQKEHDEVYAWFSHHKALWTNTPTYYGKNQTIITKDYNTRQVEGNNKIAYFDLHLWDAPAALTVIASNPSNYNSYLTGKGITSDYYKYFNTDGSFNLEALKNEDETKYKNFLKENLGYGSLVNYESNDLGDASMGTTISFTNAWIQHIANDKNVNDELAENGTSKYNSANMDYFQVWDYNASTYQNESNHLKDWNNSQGYGYGKQGSSASNQNASLVIGVDNNNWTYGCSAGGSYPHDKFYIVYLKGDGYEGYYLGADFEADKPNAATNERVPANGICNDWIIKINNFGDYTNYNPARIMCEDLGGDDNTVTIGSTVHVSDIDYNDVVLDVTYNTNTTEVTLTLQAAGGTLPLVVMYEDTPLFETHEMFDKQWDWDQASNGTNSRSDVSYSTMFNTGSETNGGTATPQTFKLYFNGSGPTSGSHMKKFGTGTKFDFSKIKLKVYRLSTEDYIDSNPNAIIYAEWVDIGNETGDAPLKLCVPQTVKWLKERESIKNGYPSFHNWVVNPIQKFWEQNDAVENKLY